MLRLQNFDRLLRRHRRTTALVGTFIVLGVAALDAHAALPEHHDRHGVATVCIAALAIATLAALGWHTKDVRSPTRPLRLVRLPRPKSRIAIDVPLVMSRAGPAERFPLRR